MSMAEQQKHSGELLIITGGSGGIGLATVRRFLTAGYRVLNLSRRPIAQEGVEQVLADVQQADWLAACATQLQAAATKASRITLIHNAARHDSDSVCDLDAENFREVLQVNLVAPQQLNALLIPFMKPGSSILYVGTTLAEKAVAGCASYVASKHAVIGLMRATVQDLVGRNIHSACVCPGFTDTAMLRGQMGDDPAVEAAITGMVSQGRLIAPEEIAETLFFCAGNPVISGSVIHANLGQIER